MRSVDDPPPVGHSHQVEVHYTLSVRKGTGKRPELYSTSRCSVKATQSRFLLCTPLPAQQPNVVVDVAENTLLIILQIDIRHREQLASRARCLRTQARIPRTEARKQSIRIEESSKTLGRKLRMIGP